MKYIISLFLIAFPCYCFSQIHVSLSAGHGGFSMRDMKQHQSELRKQFPADVEVIESFPSSWFYEFSAMGEIPDHLRIGAMVGYSSTDGRMHYKDLSGKIECDQITTAVSFAIIGDLLLNPDHKFLMSFNWKAGAMFGRYRLNTLLEFPPQHDAENIKFYSTNFFIEPGFRLSKRLFSKVSATLSAGYNFNVVCGKLYWVEDNDFHLQDDSGDKIVLDWSGYRLSAGVSIAL
jgi:hypothetical protein